MNSPILITGSHRSGTTWLGKMIACSPQVFYIHEPFNVSDPPGDGICGAKFGYWYTQVNSSNEHLYYRPIKKTINLSYDFLGQVRSYDQKNSYRKILSEYRNFIIAKLLHRRALLKDPLALFSADWLSEKFRTQNIILIRHPAAFTSSLKRKNWSFDFSNFAKQDPLFEHPSFLFKNEVLEYAKSPKNIVDQSILLWKIIHSKILAYQKEYPGWMFVRHEDISIQPVEEYRKIFDYLGLEFSLSIQKRITEYSSANNPREADQGITHTLKRDSKANVKSWKSRLSDEEISRIYDGVKEISNHFYTDNDWE